MIKFLAFLLILCILFGVDATRSFIFGTLGIGAVAIIGLLAFCLFIYLLNAIDDKSAKRQNNKDENRQDNEHKRQKEKLEQKNPALTFGLSIILLLSIIGFICIFIFLK